MSTPNSSLKCPTCEGIGQKVRIAPSKLYTCGFRTEAYPCPDCLGSGRVLPVDMKAVAAGEVA